MTLLLSKMSMTFWKVKRQFYNVIIKYIKGGFFIWQK